MPPRSRSTIPRRRPAPGVGRLLARLLARLLVAVGIGVLVLAAGTGVASAHATLVASTPADGQTVAEPPQLVTATFSEAVTAEVGGLSVRDRDGDRVDEGNSSAQANTLQVTLPSDLPDGTYVVTYRVQSADGHPVSGSWVFGIGTEPVDPSAVAGTGDGPWEAFGAVARFVTYLSALVAAGVAFFLAFVHDQRADRWKLAPIVRVAAVVGLIGVAGTIAAQAALLSGRGWAAVTDTDVLRSTLTDRLGWSAAVLLIGLAAVHLSTDTNRLLLAQVLSFYGGLTIAVGFALWGHAVEAPARWLAVGSDVLHVATAAVWLGGLVGLAVVLRRRAPRPVRSTSGVVARFSDVAAVTVVLLAAAGVTMAWIETGSVDALLDTTYGRLVLLKVAVTLLVVAMAAYNRFRLLPAVVAGVADQPEEPDLTVVTLAASATDAADDADTEADGADPEARWHELRRLVTYEALALVAVLALTSVLVSTTPGRTAVEERGATIALTEPTDLGSVSLLVTPARVGTNTVHVQYLDADGNPLDVATTLSVELALPDKQLGPITRDVVKIAPGHFLLEGDEMSVAGEWTLTLAVRTSDFTEERTTFLVPIAP